jgi:hypothetical protein
MIFDGQANDRRLAAVDRVRFCRESRDRVLTRVGAVYEHYLDCDETLYNSCSQVYPEAVFGVSF